MIYVQGEECLVNYYLSLDHNEERTFYQRNNASINNKIVSLSKRIVIQRTQYQ